MDLVEQVHFFGLTNTQTFGLIISLIRLLTIVLDYAKPRILYEVLCSEFYHDEFSLYYFQI